MAYSYGNMVWAMVATVGLVTTGSTRMAPATWHMIPSHGGFDHVAYTHMAIATVQSLGVVAMV
jgi:hypothetical protein